MHILILGVNHATAPVELRERLAFPEEVQAAALSQLVNQYGVDEAAVLCTCNRCEFYAVSSDLHGLDGVRRYLAQEHDIELAQLAPSFYEFADADAAMHLFRVACGIDSLVIGESQILGQVRDALELSQRQRAARALINEVFQRALKVGKRARSETDIGRGRLSVSTAAVELAGQIFDRLEGRSALLLGAGEMIELTAQYLVDGGISKFVVANRTLARAQELSRRYGGEAIPFDDFPTQLDRIDIVISSTAAPDFIISRAMIESAMSRRRGRPLFLIDIAVPRDIDPAVRDTDNLFLFDIDDLEGVVQANRQEREQEISQVQMVIDEEHGDFVRWLYALGTGPLVKSLRRRADDLRQQELDRWMSRLAHLSDEDRETIEAVLRGYANKLLHHPLVEIRKLAGEEDGYVRLETVRRLFGIDGARDGFGADSADVDVPEGEPAADSRADP